MALDVLDNFSKGALTDKIVIDITKLIPKLVFPNILLTVLRHFKHSRVKSILIVIKIVSFGEDIFQLVRYRILLQTILQLDFPFFIIYHLNKLELKLSVVQAYFFDFALQLKVFTCEKFDVILHRFKF